MQREDAARKQGASEESIAKEVLEPKEGDAQPLSEEEIAGGGAGGRWLWLLGVVEAERRGQMGHWGGAGSTHWRVCAHRRASC